MPRRLEAGDSYPAEFKTLPKKEQERLNRLFDVSDLLDIDPAEDSGLSSSQLREMIFGMDRMIKVKSQDPVEAGNEINLLREQLAIVIRRENSEAALKPKDIFPVKMPDVKDRITRREFLEALKLVGVATVFFGVVGGLIYKESLDDEEFKKNEAANLLGVNPTKISESGWRIRYALKEEVEYQEVGKFKVEKDTYLVFGDESSLNRDTKMTVRMFDSTRGVTVPMLTFLAKGDGIIKKVLRDQNTDEIDNRAVIFERLQDDEVVGAKYVSIVPMQSEPRYFSVKILQKVTK